MSETTSTSSITFQQANTTDGSYDVHQPRPYPVTVQAAEPRRAYIGHPTNPGPKVGNLVGFVDSPDDYNPKYLVGLPSIPNDIVGMFPVYAADAGFWTDTRPVEAIVSVETTAVVSS